MMLSSAEIVFREAKTSCGKDPKKGRLRTRQPEAPSRVKKAVTASRLCALSMPPIVSTSGKGCWLERTAKKLIDRYEV